MNKTGLTVLLAGWLLLTGCGADHTEIITTTSGDLRGVRSEGFELFRGIPYAAAPTDELRWRAPKPHPGWSGTLDTTEFGAQCWQPTNSGNDQFLVRLAEGSGMSGVKSWLLTTLGGLVSANTSEDCLFLNVATPDRSGSLPVMFWIHGGGHQFGSGGGPYESLSLAGEGIVLVSINYRLGLYGFLAHPELAAEDPNGSTGNYGTLDQIAALEWVRDNIAAFGGDPQRVTIFGESAGGHSVGQLMASPVARGLFHRAIAQSGTGFYQFQAVDAAHERMSGFDGGRELARRAGVAGDDEISGLRAMTTEELAELATDPELSETFHPQIDGYVLPGPTAAIFARGEQAAVPLIVGSNADEGSLLYYFGLPAVDGGPPAQPQTMKDWDDLLAAEFGSAAAALDAEYAVDGDANVPSAAESLMGDTWFGRHAYYMAQAHSAHDQPTYLYFYTRHPPAVGQTLGASHALELAHVFGGFLPFWPWDERDDALQAEMQGHWAQFAATGNPNRDGLAEWRSFDALSPSEMNYGHDVTANGPVARRARYEAMRGQFQRRLQASGYSDSTSAANRSSRGKTLSADSLGAVNTR